MQRIQVIILIIVALAGVWYAYTRSADFSFRELFFSSYHTIHIGTTPIKVDLALTEAERRQGLSGRDELEEINGLLFVFDEPGYHGIWMKDMRFSIDIIWISEDLRVIDIRQHATPSSFPRIFEPSSPAKYVLETNAFFTDVYGIRVGDEVVLPESLQQ